MNKTLDRNHPLPMYYQLKEIIREKVMSGEWKPGELIPSERELSRQYGISRMTVRQAFNELTQEGVLRRKQGVGSFVAELKIEQQLTGLTGFTEDMRKRGLQPRARVLTLETILPSTEVAAALQISPEQPIVLLERLRMVGEEPMAIEASHLHFPQVSGLLEEDFERRSLYELLTQKYNIVPTRAKQSIEAALPDRREQKLLGLPSGSPVLKNRRTTFDQHGRPFEYTKSAYRGDSYVFYAELTVHPETQELLPHA